MKWAITNYHVKQRPGHNYIESSIGRPYRELKTIARRMNSNGEGQRYAVVRYNGLAAHEKEPELSIAFREAGLAEAMESAIDDTMERYPKALTYLAGKE